MIISIIINDNATIYTQIYDTFKNTYIFRQITNYNTVLAFFFFVQIRTFAKIITAKLAKKIICCL